MIKIWKCGGCVRDEIIGAKSKDIDYSVEADSFEAMEQYIIAQGGKIFLSTPEFATIRAIVNGEAADYVWARKEGPYSDGRHPDWTEPGTILDDLTRRDFTMNAIAKDAEGNYYDPFSGIQDIEAGVIRCVGSAYDKMTADSLRIIRAARFSITKGFEIDAAITDIMNDAYMTSRIPATVSTDRIRDEIGKMFRASTVASIAFFGAHPHFAEAVFGSGEVWMKATTENK
jgi:tRNA nucleotidyltransferase (CCA-adding enzyme)